MSLRGNVSEGETRAIQRFTARITPAYVEVGRFVPTRCRLNVRPEDSERVREALTAQRYTHHVFGITPEHVALDIDCGYEPIADAIRTLTTLFPNVEIDDPYYWFSLDEMPDRQQPDLYIIDIGHTHYTLQIHQALPAPGAQPRLAPYGPAQWHAFVAALNDSPLCDMAQWIPEDAQGSLPYIRLLLTDAASRMFEPTLHDLMRRHPKI